MSTTSNVDRPPARHRALSLFRREIGNSPSHIVRSPGRVNLIGEHTDYNGGFVFPMALEHATYLAFAPRDDNRVRLFSEGYHTVEFSTIDGAPERGWANYGKGVLVRLSDAGFDSTGFDAAVASDIPIGAGLSSSAALEVALGLAVAPHIDRTDLAHHAQWVENEWLGIPSGIMDQLIVATATEDHLKLIDCRSLESTDHLLSSDLAVVVLDTSTRRSLVGSEYAERRQSCERVASELGAQSLRDLTIDDVEDAALDPIDRARARHVIEENDRTIAAANALGAGDAETVGRLMNESHVSMRDLFDISSLSLNAMVEAAQDAPGCYGARMTGGGFAGCAVALVDRTHLDDFTTATAATYAGLTDLEPAIYASGAAAGASIEPLAGSLNA